MNNFEIRKSIITRVQRGDYFGSLKLIPMEELEKFDSFYTAIDCCYGCIERAKGYNPSDLGDLNLFLSDLSEAWEFFSEAKSLVLGGDLDLSDLEDLDNVDLALQLVEDDFLSFANQYGIELLPEEAQEKYQSSGGKNLI